MTIPRLSPSGKGFTPSHVHFGHMSYQTTTPFTLVGSGTSAVEIPDNAPTVVWEGPTPSSLNNEFSVVQPDPAGAPKLKRLRWGGLHNIACMVIYYGTFELSGGGTALVELSLSRNGLVDPTSTVLAQVSGNRPNEIIDTSLILLAPGDELAPMIENVEPGAGAGIDLAAYSAHLAVVGAVELGA